MPLPLKTVARVVAALTTTASEAGSRVGPQTGRGKIPVRSRPKEISGTLAALKRGTPSALTRPSITAATTRREVGGSAALRTQSMPSSPSRTASRLRTRAPADLPRPPLPTSARAVPQSNSDLQQALQNHANVFMPPANATEEHMQLQHVIAKSLTETPEHAHEPHAQHEPGPAQRPAQTPVDAFAASQDAQMQIQVAMKKAEVRKAGSEAMKELTKG